MDDMALIIEVNRSKLCLARLLVNYQQVIMELALCFAGPGREFRPALALDDLLIQIEGECR